MKAIKLDTFHYTKNATDVTPKGTLMVHYALEGSKEELDAYEEAKGTYYKTVETGEHAGKPIWFTSQKNLSKVGESLEVKMNNAGIINPVLSLEEAEAKEQVKRDALAADKKTEKFFVLAAKHKVAIQIA